MNRPLKAVYPLRVWVGCKAHATYKMKLQTYSFNIRGSGSFNVFPYDSMVICNILHNRDMWETYQIIYELWTVALPADFSNTDDITTLAVLVFPEKAFSGLRSNRPTLKANTTNVSPETQLKTCGSSL